MKPPIPLSHSGRIAVAQLVLHDGRTLHNQVLQLSPAGQCLHYAPLTREQAFTTWYKGCLHLNQDLYIVSSR